MTERGVAVDHVTFNRLVVHYSQQIADQTQRSGFRPQLCRHYHCC